MTRQTAFRRPGGLRRPVGAVRVAQERDATVALITHLAELDARRLYLAEGSVTLTTVGLLAPYLTGENHRALLAQARHKSRREVEQLIAALRPQPPVVVSAALAIFAVRGSVDYAVGVPLVNSRSSRGSAVTFLDQRRP